MKPPVTDCAREEMMSLAEWPPRRGRQLHRAVPASRCTEAATPAPPSALTLHFAFIFPKLRVAEPRRLFDVEPHSVTSRRGGRGVGFAANHGGSASAALRLLLMTEITGDRLQFKLQFALESRACRALPLIDAKQG